jgi:hypothetical protein
VNPRAGLGVCGREKSFDPAKNQEKSKFLNKIKLRQQQEDQCFLCEK